jgi:hypothetical protein
MKKKSHAMRTANVAARKIVTLVEAETQKDIGWQTTFQIIQIVNRAIKKEKSKRAAAQPNA